MAVRTSTVQAVTTRRRWYQKQVEGALVLPKRTIPGQRRPRFADGLHRPVGLIFASGHVLFTACQLSGQLPWRVPASADLEHCMLSHKARL